jgi:lipopolysaccharide/colanic/teichoic acid biosynthesis glycosyltransferase
VDSAPPTVNIHSARSTVEPAAGAWQSALCSSTMPAASSALARRCRSHPFKRLLDICVSLTLLIVLLPLLVLLALLLWAQNDGPVLYVSQRIGRNGRPFTMYKFRSMVVGAELLKHRLNQRNERAEILFKIANDPRTTRIGRVLRKYSLDEIPQLINVIRGDMSLVGPRPPLACEVEQYSPHQFIRLEVLPGITGLWQINARRSSSFHDYISLDAAYVQNWCLWLDLKILWRTVGVVLAGTGD